MKFISLFYLFALFNSSLLANSTDTQAVDSVFLVDEARLSKKVVALVANRFDDAKMDELASDLMLDFLSVLEKQGSFDYPFDSITQIGKVMSTDGLLRIFTWYAIKANGEHVQYGYVQYHSKVKKQVLLYPLIDNSANIEEPQLASLSSDNWFGATYYDIIESKSSYGKLYVLLGWDGNDIFTNKKVVESLVFTESGRPKFGKPVFVADRSKVKRIIFEYSRMASMMLNYSTDLDMIIMDHLSPSKAVYNGNRQYYGPDLSYDGLKFEDGLWVYKPSIDFRPEVNKKRKK